MKCPHCGKAFEMKTRMKVPFGRNKGEPIESLSTKDLESLLAFLEKTFDPAGKFAENNQKQIDILTEEIKKRTEDVLF